MIEATEVEAPSIMQHGKGCWMKPGHHGCAITLLKSLDGNLLAAFSLRGSMIAGLSQKLADEKAENRRLRDKLAGRS